MRNAMVVLSWVVLAGCGPDAVATTDGMDTVQAEDGLGASTWWPLQSGNTWELRQAGVERSVKVARVEDVRVQVSGVWSEPTWLTTSGSTLLKWDGARWVTFVRFGGAPTWTINNGPCEQFKVRRSVSQSLSVAAGTFKDVVVVRFEQVTDPSVRCVPPPFTELTFARGIGPVAFTTGRAERFELGRAVVGCQHVPGEVESLVKLDSDRYTSKPNTIRCVTTPCPNNEKTAVAHLAFEVKNSTQSTQSWWFATGCQHDVELVSAAGAVVRRLSDGQICTQATTTLVLKPGASQRYSADLELKDAEGLQLDGAFTARAFLRGVKDLPAATASFSVTVQSPVPAN